VVGVRLSGVHHCTARDHTGGVPLSPRLPRDIDDSALMKAGSEDYQQRACCTHSRLLVLAGTDCLDRELMIR